MPSGWRRKASKERLPTVVIALAFANIVTFVLEANGNFVYTFSDGTNVEECKGTWKINNLGFISFNASGPYKIGKFVMFSVYDKEDKSLYLGGNDDFLGDGLALKKSK